MTPLLSFVAGTILSLTVWWTASRAELKLLRVQFESASDNRIFAIRREVDEAAHCGKSLRPNDLHSLIEHAFSYLRPHGVSVEISDLDQGGRVVHFHRSRMELQGMGSGFGLAFLNGGRTLIADHVRDIRAGGRNWRIRCSAVPGYLAAGTTWQPAILLFCGLAATLLLSLRLSDLAYRNREIQNIVKTRTRELALARDAAMEASRIKSQFLANVSHEIRTPLNGILGMSELLSGTRLDREQAEFVGLIRTSGSNLMDLVNDLLDLTRLEAGRIQIEEETLAIRDAVEETACILANQARSKGLQFSVHVEDSLPVYVLGDKARLRQVLLNLAGNAVKFTESGSVRVVVLRTDCPNASERIRFEVHDTGPGISEQARPALFQRFSQADSSLARRHGGAGLGLAISRHLVELMDGSIGVDSRAGTGSVFWFELPLRLSAPSAPGAAVLPGARLG